VEMIKVHERLWTPDPADPPPVPVVEAAAQEVSR
jgi:hypothetical protein